MQFEKLAPAVLVCLVLSCSSSRTVSTSGSVARTDPSGALPRTAAPAPIHSSIRNQIDSILDDSLLSSCFLGVKIVSLDDSAMLYERNSNKLFHPASNMKLLTAAAAINLLDEDFKFITRVFTDRNPSNGVLIGNLYVKGSGDPLLSTNDFDSIASAIRSYGVQTIAGDIVGDASYFDSLQWGHGWMWDDEPEADEAFISPLTVNGNSVKVTVDASRNPGRRPAVQIEPSTTYVDVVNDATTSSDTSGQPLEVIRQSGTNTILVRGKVVPGSSDDFNLSVARPALYYLHLLRERLSLHGISVRGDLRLDSIRGGVKLVEFAHPIDSILHRINKNSDNISAENLLKTLAAERLGAPGSAVNGLTLVKEYLANEGVDTTAMILADGSGVSWYNAVTPAALVQILQKQYQRKATFKRFYESLSIAGRDGTLKNRMKGTLAADNVHAKTGSLTGNSCISGYLTTVDGKLITFSILCNHFPQNISVLRDAQDKILEMLVNMRLNAR